MIYMKFDVLLSDFEHIFPTEQESTQKKCRQLTVWSTTEQEKQLDAQRYNELLRTRQ